MKKGDKLYCLETVTNIIGMPLFIKGKTYTILHVDEYNNITLDHILYANEYADYDIDWVKEHFVTLKEARQLKLNEINSKDE